MACPTPRPWFDDAKTGWDAIDTDVEKRTNHRAQYENDGVKVKREKIHGAS